MILVVMVVPLCLFSHEDVSCLDLFRKEPTL